MTSIQEKLQQAKILLEEALSEMDKVPTKKSAAPALMKKTVAIADIDFSTNPRAFFKQHAGKLTGPKKFVLVLAYLAKGGDTAHSADAVAHLWGQVEGLMGGSYARVYSTRAKEQDWVDSPKTGSYVLRPTWKQIFA